MIIKLGAIAAAIAAILGLVFLVDPNLRPKPSPSATAGKITNVTWEQPYSGDVHYYVDVEITGYDGQTCALGYSVYTGGGQYAGLASTDAVDFQAQSNNDTGGATVAVTQPNAAGTYYVIFTLYAPNGTKLDVKTSPEFNVS